MIKGLSDRIQITRLGKIHLGEKKKSSKSDNLYPSATDYFVVHEDINTPKEIAERFHQIYGKRPKELNIMFPLDDLEKFFPQWLKRYANGTLVCKGDGEKAIETDLKTGERKEIICSYRNCPYYKKKQCKEIGNLQFYVSEIPGGVFQIDTSSFNSIVRINTDIRIIKEQNNGHIAGIPLKLILRPLQVTVNGYPKTIYILHLYQPEKHDIVKKEPVKEPNMPELPNTDDIPEDLFPAGIDNFDTNNSTDSNFEIIDEPIDDPFDKSAMNAEYGPLKVDFVKELKPTNEPPFFGAILSDEKGKKYNVTVDKDFKSLEGKTLIAYEFVPNGKYKKLISYKVLEDVQEA